MNAGLKPHDASSSHLAVPLVRQRSRSRSRSRSPSNLSTTSLLSEDPLEANSQPSTPSGRHVRPKHARQRSNGSFTEKPSAAPSFVTRNKGILLVLLAQAFGVLMNVTTRLLETSTSTAPAFDPFQILFARMSLTMLLSLLYMWWAGIPDAPLGAKGVRKLLVARGMGGFFGVFGLYYSLQYLPLSDCTVLSFLAPPLACYACSLLLKEPFTRVEQIAGLVSLGGVVLIARPSALFHSASAPVSTDPTTHVARQVGEPLEPTSSQRLAAVGMSMVGVVGASIAYTTIRWIGKRAHPLLSVNYFATWCTIVSATAMALVPGVEMRWPATLREWALLIFLGVNGFVMQFLLTAGLRYEKSSRATNMVYTQMLFALVFDFLVWGIMPNWLSVAGSSLILGSALVVALYKEKSSPAKETSNADEEAGFIESHEGQQDRVELRNISTSRS